MVSLKKNPYDCNNFRGKFNIMYAGFSDEFHCFRVKLNEHKGIDACMFEMELSDWLFNETHGVWYMGNGFDAGKNFPKIDVSNTEEKDCLVLLKKFTDVVAFEDKFEVTGLTPSMLVE